MRSGKLDRRVRIERLSDAGRDAFNEEIEAWALVAEVWASKEEVRDSERVAAQELGAEIGVRFRIRWSATVSDVNPRDRLEFPVGSGTYFNIVAVKEIGRRRGLEISAIARSDQA